MPAKDLIQAKPGTLGAFLARRIARRPDARAWVVAAFGAALALGAGAIAVHGPGKAGAEAALRLTARLAFLLFWPRYVSGALVTLLGPAFQPVRERTRVLGLAFASVLVVHLGFVARLSWVGAVPSAQTFLIFGVGAIWTGLLALCSVERFGRIAGANGWWVLRHIGLNYIAFAFALDFLRPHAQAGLLREVEYLPFAGLAMLGPALRALAWLKPRLARVGAAAGLS